MSTTFSKKSKNLFFSSDVTVFSLHEQHDASLNFWFRTHIILAKNVPWHILTLSAVACDMFLLRASAHHWHVSAFLCNREFQEIPITQKTVVHFCTTVFFIYLQNCTLNFFYSLSFILQEITSSYLSLTITFWLSPRPISNSQLHVLLRFHLCPIYLVVFKGSYYLRMGYLILRGASRLDAFSVYPVPAWLLCHELDSSTDTPEASPPRSSRTKGSSSQISYARAG